jgi:predicted O-methyltransferase YrrM
MRELFQSWFTTVSRGPRLAAEHGPFVSARELGRRVHGGDIYEAFPHEAFRSDTQGWNSESPVFGRLLREVRPHRVVELGTWKGASALHMCDLARDLGLSSFVIVCVDTWLGGLWHWQERSQADSHASLACRHGYPQVYFQFLANVIKAGHADRVVPFPNSTDVGAEFFQSLGFGDVDLLYIDAAHTYEAVYADICNWWPLVRSGGTVFGDDFTSHYPGVEQAVRRFCQEHELSFENEREKWIIRKP